jgi:hypothetical protein
MNSNERIVNMMVLSQERVICFCHTRSYGLFALFDLCWSQKVKKYTSEVGVPIWWEE